MSKNSGYVGYPTVVLRWAALCSVHTERNADGCRAEEWGDVGETLDSNVDFEDLGFHREIFGAT